MTGGSQRRLDPESAREYTRQLRARPSSLPRFADARSVGSWRLRVVASCTWREQRPSVAVPATHPAARRGRNLSVADTHIAHMSGRQSGAPSTGTMRYMGG